MTDEKDDLLPPADLPVPVDPVGPPPSFGVPE